jgi:hypothetical protein
VRWVVGAVGRTTLSGNFLLRVKFGADPGDRFLEIRQITRHRIPHDVQIDIEVAMGHPVTHVGDDVPRHFGMRITDLEGYQKLSSASFRGSPSNC